MLDNLILSTDSYKLTHHAQYPKGTERVYSYLEARQGAEFPTTVFFGLQSILKQIELAAFSVADIGQAAWLAESHFGNPYLFNRKGWHALFKAHRGALPLRIKAVPEGTRVPAGNVLMTVENTDPEFPWLTNFVESLLLHVWYPTTVASLSYSVKQMLRSKLHAAGASDAGLRFMLHDFGYRGVSSQESAEMGGMGHLVSFQGTDTLSAMTRAMRDYNADLASLAFSVPATEHSVMTALGRDGELDQVDRVLAEYPNGILSVVADSYDIYRFLGHLRTRKDEIMARDGVFVVRPDSVTQQHPQPGDLVAHILHALWDTFGGTENQKGYRVLDPHVRVLWGDGIDPHGIEKIVNRAMVAGYSPENLVFGMGGGLLQKVNRDTQRFAFKASAMQINGEWRDVQKQPLDASKLSKAGRLKLVKRDPHGLCTVQESENLDDILHTVFEDGVLYNETTFDQVRERANF